MSLPSKVINFGVVNVASVATIPLEFKHLSPSGVFTASTYLRITLDQEGLFPIGIPYYATTSSGVVTEITASGTADVSLNHIRSRMVDLSGCQWGGTNNGGEAPIDVTFTVDGSANPRSVRMHTGNFATPLSGRMRTSLGEQIVCMAVTAMKSYTPTNLSAYVTNLRAAATLIETNISQAINDLLMTQGAQNAILQNITHNNGSVKIPISAEGGRASLANADAITLAFRLSGIDVTLTSRNANRKIMLSGIPLFITLGNFKNTRQLSMMDFPNTPERGITWSDATTRAVSAVADRVVLAGKSRGATLLYDPPRRMTYDIPQGSTVFTNMDASFNVHGLYRVLNNGYSNASNANDSSNFPDVEAFSDGSIVISFAYVNTASAPVRCKLLNVLTGTVITEYPTTTASGAVAFTVLDSTGLKITDRVVQNIDGTFIFFPYTDAPAGIAAGIVANKAKTAFYACLSVGRSVFITEQTNTSISRGVAVATFPSGVTDDHMRLLIKFDTSLRVQWSAIMQPFIVNPSPTNDGGVYIGARVATGGKGQIYDSNGNLITTLRVETDALGNTVSHNHVVCIGPADSGINVKWVASVGLPGTTPSIGNLNNELVDIESTSDGGVLAVYVHAAGKSYNVFSAGASTPYVPILPNNTSTGTEMLSIIKFSSAGAYAWTTFQYSDEVWNADGNANVPYNSMSRRYLLGLNDGGFIMTSNTRSTFTRGDIANVDNLIHTRTLFKPENGPVTTVPTVRTFTVIDNSPPVTMGVAGQGVIRQGLGLWLDATDRSTLSITGANAVSEWRDKSGNGRHFAQSTTNRQPPYENNVINGYPSIKTAHNSANCPLFRNANTMGTLASSTAMTFFGVAFRNTVDWGTIFQNNKTASGTVEASRFEFHLRNNKTDVQVTTAGSTALGRGTAANQSYVFAASISGSGILSYMSLNGAETQFTPTANMISTVSSSTSVFSVGDTLSPGVSSASHVSEIVMYDRALTVAERKSMENYLMAKYAIAPASANAFNIHVSKFDANGVPTWVLPVYPGDTANDLSYRNMSFNIGLMPSTEDILGLNAYKGTRVIDASGRFVEQSTQNGQFIKIAKTGNHVAVPRSYYSNANAMMPNDTVASVQISSDTYCYPLQRGKFTDKFNIPRYDQQTSIYVPKGLVARIMDGTSLVLNEPIVGPAFFPAGETFPASARMFDLKHYTLTPAVSSVFTDRAFPYSRIDTNLPPMLDNSGWIWNYPQQTLTAPGGGTWGYGAWTPTGNNTDFELTINIPGSEPVLGALTLKADDFVRYITLNGTIILDRQYSGPHFAPSNFWLVPGINRLLITARNTAGAGYLGAVVTNALTGEIIAKTDGNTLTKHFKYELGAQPFSRAIPLLGASSTFLKTTYGATGAEMVTTYPYMNVSTAHNLFKFGDSSYQFDLDNSLITHDTPVTLVCTSEGTGTSVIKIDVVSGRNIVNTSIGAPGASGIARFTLPYGKIRVSINVRNSDDAERLGVIFYVTRDADNALLFASNRNNVFSPMHAPVVNYRIGAGPCARGATFINAVSVKVYSFGNRTIGNNTSLTANAPIDITTFGEFYSGPRAHMTTSLGYDHAILSSYRSVGAVRFHYAYGDNTYGQLGIEEIFPVKPMFSNSLSVNGESYGNGTYTAQASSSDAFNETAINAPYGCFTFDLLTSWTSVPNRYDSSGSYTNNQGLVIGYSGEWIRIDLPEPIRVTRYDVGSRVDASSNAPCDLRLYGRFNNGPWEVVDDETNIAYSSNMATCSTYYVTGSGSLSVSGYNSYAFVVSKTAGGTGKVNMNAKLYGSRLKALTPVTLNNIGGNWPMSPALQQVFPPVGTMTASSVVLTSANAPYGYGTYATNASSFDNVTPPVQIYPPYGMSAGPANFPLLVTDMDYGNGLYIASTSSVNGSNELPGNLFNRQIRNTTGFWWTSGLRYNSGTGAYTGPITTSGVTGAFAGEWVQLEMSNPARITQVNIHPRHTDTTILSRNPSSFVIIGSNDGIVFTQLLSVSNYTSWDTTNGTASTFTLTTPGSYKFYRMSISKVIGGTNGDKANISEIVFLDTNQIISTATLKCSPHAAFNGSLSTCWTSSGLYNLDGTYAGTKFLVAGYTGEWTTITLPVPIRLSRFDVVGIYGLFTNAPGLFKVYGSTDGGTTWTELHNQTGRLTFNQSTQRQSFFPTNTSTYNMFGIVVNTLANGGANKVHANFVLYGTKGRFASSPIGNLQTRVNNAIACGRDFTIFLQKDYNNGNVQDAYAIGRNDNGQLGLGHTRNLFFPEQVHNKGSLNGRFLANISAGDKHVVALDTMGCVHTWGSNSHGQLGNNIASNVVITPSCITQMYGSLASDLRALYVFAGMNSSFAIDLSGNVHAWGDNDNGCLGVSPFSPGAIQSVPASLAGRGTLAGSTIYKGAAGDGFAVVLDISGRVHTWGKNNAGQCGQGLAAPSVVTAPGLVQGILSNVVVHHITAGANTAYAMDKVNTGYSWGQGTNGELGNGVNASSMLPVHIGAFSYSLSRVPQFSLPLDKLTPSGQAALCGAYALVRLSTSYTGPTVRLRRSGDSTITDFYADVSGNLTTVINGGGDTLASWVGQGTAYVQTWYDQSGKGRDASQNILLSQPTIPAFGGVLDLTTADTWFSLPDGTVPSGNSSYTVTLRHGYSPKTTGTWLSSGANTNNNANTFNRETDKYKNYWWASDTLTTANTYSEGNTVSFVYDNTIGSTTTFINGTQNGIAFRMARNSSTANNYIGRSLIVADSLQGEMYNLFIFNAALNSSDRALIEGNRAI